MEPLVSVLMPMRNAARFVERSLVSLLNQSYRNIEIIVVDDKSSDNSREIVEAINRSKIKIITGEAKGISAALNLALTSSKGDYVCRCDSDDLYPVNRLQEQVDYLQRNLSVGAVCGNYTTIDKRDTEVLAYQCGDKEELISEELKAGEVRTHLCTYLIKRAVLDRVGGCREYFVTAEDVDLQYRIAEIVDIIYLPSNYYYYRLHDSSITHSSAYARNKFFDIQARKFLSQRLTSGIDDVQQGVAKEPPSSLEGTPAHNSKKQIQQQLIGMAWRYFNERKTMESIKIGFRACLIRPTSMLTWKSWLILLFRTFFNK